jgi:Uma2 family endonuclease
MDTRTLQTFEQFEQYPDDGMKHELLKGEHIVAPPPKFRHSTLQHKLLHLLWPYVQQHKLGDVRIETGFKLSVYTWLQPDVSFVRTAQIQTTGPNDYCEGAPALAVEVASDSNTAAQLDLKIEQYVAHGSDEVWVVYPKTRKVLVHLADGGIRTVAGSELRSNLFPDWSVQVDALFEV